MNIFLHNKNETKSDLQDYEDTERLKKQNEIMKNALEGIAQVRYYDLCGMAKVALKQTGEII